MDSNCAATVIIGDARCMAEVGDAEVHVVVTSPPYWQIKDYGSAGQIGYGQSLHEYLLDLSRVWRECWRVLKPGRRLCINIGDQFARASLYGRYKVIPTHAEIIAQCEAIGFDYLGSIIWRKKTTMRTSGGAVIMGSFPHPPNGIVELDYEHILLFKKPGETARVSPEVKAASALTTREWKEYFQGHWQFSGTRQSGHEAMFPDELPRRLIRMFSFAGDTVLDPFLGSGTTAKVALELGRSAIGFEMQAHFVPIIQEKLGLLGLYPQAAAIHPRTTCVPPVDPPASYCPHVQDLRPLATPPVPLQRATFRVVEVSDERTVLLDDASLIALLGIAIPAQQRTAAREYLHTYVQGKRVLVRDARPPNVSGSPTAAYLYLANRIFINRKMIDMGLAVADPDCDHRLRQRFLAAEAAAQRMHL